MMSGAPLISFIRLPTFYEECAPYTTPLKARMSFGRGAERYHTADPITLQRDACATRLRSATAVVSDTQSTLNRSLSLRSYAESRLFIRRRWAARHRGTCDSHYTNRCTDADC